MKRSIDWEQVFNAFPLPIFLHDRRGHLVAANAAYLTSAGLPLEEVLGRPYWEVFPQTPSWPEACRRAVEEGRSEPSE
ncbi:MAG: PAS domain-containing protein, partial [Gammaproteobacteria bacterium]